MVQVTQLQPMAADARPRSRKRGARPADDELRAILAAGSIRSVYQPVTHLASGRTVGYEALARGPAASLLEAPNALFAAAREQGLLNELDWACRISALRGAMAQPWPADQTLFMNVEPATLDEAMPNGADRLLDEAGARLRVVIELTERALVANPPGLFRAVDRIRRRGWGVALDDVGSEPASAAMLSLLRPDVIKLDLRLIQERHTRDSAAQLVAILAEAERTGAVLLAEGIETARHERTARAYGATYGQGWLFGRPGDLPKPVPASGAAVPFLEHRPALSAAATMSAILGNRHASVAVKGDLVAFSRHLERLALASPDPTVILAALQHVRHFTPATRRTYDALGRDNPLVAVFGVGVDATPGTGLRGVALQPDDPLTGQWHVVVLGAQFAGALIAEDLGDTGEDLERRFRYRITFDRDIVIEAARPLADRILPTTD